MNIEMVKKILSFVTVPQVKTIVLTVAVTAFSQAYCAWYWPFGDDENKRPRISEIVAPASELIDEAGDLASEGKIEEAIEKYRKALLELDRIEMQYPSDVGTPEFLTVKNKRAYVKAAVNSILFSQARKNARAVTVTDTTSLEAKFNELKSKKNANPSNSVKKVNAKATTAKKPDVRQKKQTSETKAAKKKSARETIAEALKKDPSNRKLKLMLAAEDLKVRDFDAAELVAKELISVRPDDAAALNIKAAAEMGRGDYDAAEKTLDSAIRTNPRKCHAYYNMAKLILRKRGAEGKDAARRYYSTGRTFGGKEDSFLEQELK
jgi:tetratricopeptide (TPR) repeat protein